jgi:ABC-2 type transport system permease protein
MAGIADRGSGSTHSRPATAAKTRRWQGVSFRVHPSHIRTLMWLRWKLTLRGYTRNTGRIVSLVFILIFLVPLLGGAALATLLGYTSLPHTSAVGLLFLVVSGIYLLWAGLPLLFYTLNEGLDVTKLQIYPVTRGEQMISLLLATLLDLSTLFIVFFYAAILLGWHNSPAALAITLVALVAAYVHTVSFSQLTLAVLMGLLRTRRYRDVTIIIFALFGVACSFSGQVIARLFVESPFSNGSASQLAQAHVEQYLRWTPPGMAAQSIVSANEGQLGTSLVWLAASLILIPVVVAIWAWVLDRGITTAETAAAGGRRWGRARPARVATAAATTTTAELKESVASKRGWRPLSSAARAIAQKDALYLWRDPQLKAQLLSTLFLVVLILFPNIFSGSSSGSGDFGAPSLVGGNASVFLAILPALLVAETFTQNSLGMDRQGLQILFLFPVRPLDILFGKNLFAGTFAMIFMAVLAVIKGALTGGWLYVPLTLCGGLAAVLLVMGCGNISSVLLPFRWRQMRMGETGTLAGENGCLRSVLQMVVLAVVAILLVPVAVALLAPSVLGHSEWYAFSVPAVLAYGILFHQLATRLVAPILQRRVPDILAVTVRET